MVAACLQTAAVRPAIRSQTSKSARSVRAPTRCAARNGESHAEASKMAALAAAASLLLAQPSFAGPLSDKLPSSSPAPPKGLFERDLGEGRKLKVDPSDMKNNASRTTQGKKGGPSASADARAEPDVKVSGGGLPGISKKLPDSPTSAPIS